MRKLSFIQSQKQFQNKSNAVLVHAQNMSTLKILVGLSRAGLSQPKGRMWPVGWAMPRSGLN